MKFSVKGNIVDIESREIYFGELMTEKGIITSVKKFGKSQEGNHFILPGFIDSHLHIESTMLIPSEFARLAVTHGTIATVSDPHEIANVCGQEGVEYMIDNGKSVPFKFHFGAPSCVPATPFETAGASLNAAAVEELLARDDIFYLSEMMNFPGVLSKDEEVLKKINAAKLHQKPIDGHAPGLTGDEARRYIEAGISTDHECVTAEEALHKLKHGMKILIREGSAAKNFDALIHLLHEHENDMMFCSDDKHPDSLVKGHINELCARAVAIGIDIFKVLKAACINPVKHYKMNSGLLRQGDPADFIIVRDLEHFIVNQTYIDGEKVAENGQSLIQTKPVRIINHFDCLTKQPEEFRFKAEKNPPAVIEALDGQLVTNKVHYIPKIENDFFISDTERDILKITVINRYHHAPIAKGFVKNFGLRTGAIASSVAHDSHNIIAVGCNNESLAAAVNLIIQEKGGISVADHSNPEINNVLPLPVAGLMSHGDAYEVAAKYTLLDAAAKGLGSGLSAPFMTLSFMALLVIPHIKLSDKGLFDGDTFRIIIAQ